MSTAVLEPLTAPAHDVEERVTPRLSEAMRAGAQHHPQGRTHLYNKKTGATCALGALITGLMGPQWTRDDPDMFAQRGVLTFVLEQTGVDLAQRMPVPAYRGRQGVPSYALSSIIISLNDEHHWTREQIADWLASLGL